MFEMLTLAIVRIFFKRHFFLFSIWNSKVKLKSCMHGEQLTKIYNPEEEMYRDCQKLKEKLLLCQYVKETKQYYFVVINSLQGIDAVRMHHIYNCYFNSSIF